jgi:hypothetical protein
MVVALRTLTREILAHFAAAARIPLFDRRLIWQTIAAKLAEHGSLPRLGTGLRRTLVQFGGTTPWHIFPHDALLWAVF